MYVHTSCGVLLYTAISSTFLRVKRFFDCFFPKNTKDTIYRYLNRIERQTVQELAFEQTEDQDCWSY